MIGPVHYLQIPLRTHLSQGELEIWKRFTSLFPERFELVAYDYELGVPRNYDDTIPEKYAAHHRYLGGYKIDVIGYNKEAETIIEVKHQATSKALGEVWLYSEVYHKENPGKMMPRLMILTDEEMPHMREICEAEEVELVVV